jgi:Fic family protein
MTINLPLGLPARQAQFLCLPTARPSLTRADYQRLIGVSHNTAQRDLAELAAAHLVREIGKARGRR